MQKTRQRAITPDGELVEHRLTRLLDGPHLARAVPHLPPEALHEVIRHCGLEACGEILAVATPSQLRSLSDIDLWRPGKPGYDEHLDIDRFGEWLEALVEAGTLVAARAVAALDAHLVVAGLSCYIRVLDPGIFEPTAQSDDEAPDPHDSMREGDAQDPANVMAPSADGPNHEIEIGGYLVRARRGDAWDAILMLLAALETDFPLEFQAVIQGCRRLSNSRPEFDGLDDLPLAPEQHIRDVTSEREHRRSVQGYATAADARAFLEMARQPIDARSATETSGPLRANPIAAAYFRAAHESAEPGKHTTPVAPAATAPSDAHTPAVRESLELVTALLTELGVPPAPALALPAAEAGPRGARPTCLERLMASLRDSEPDLYDARSRELAFLANTLLAGGSVQARAFTPREASTAAAGICNLGLEHWPLRWPRGALLDGSTWHARGPSVTTAAEVPHWVLIRHDLVTAFEVGWAVVHQDVCLFAADQVISILAELRCPDRHLHDELAALRRALVTQRDAGTPWRARQQADVLAMLDMTAWVTVISLLDECPILPAALVAALEGRTTAVSATAFDFFSTTAQFDDVRRFMRKLPQLLSN